VEIPDDISLTVDKDWTLSADDVRAGSVIHGCHLVEY